MKEKTRILLDQVDEAHDWINGRAYSNGGTELHTTDTCQVCGLQRHYKSDTQNGIEGYYWFSDSHGEELTLIQAIGHACA
jgi:hypothetical protein